MLGAVVYLLEYRLLRWRLSGKEVEGDRIWKNLRRFSAWTCAGCVAGAVTCSLLMQSRHLEYESSNPNIVRQRFYELVASSIRYHVAFLLNHSAFEVRKFDC